MEIISHPGVPLIQHLRAVAAGCIQILSNRQISCGLPNECLITLGYIMGVTHDIAKATVNFQNYIKSQKFDRPKHHALMSAFIAKDIASSYLEDHWKSVLPKHLYEVLPYLVFTAVKRHHGNILKFSVELTNNRDKDFDLQKQINNFYRVDAESILSELLAEKNLVFDWQQFELTIKTKKYLIDFEDFGLSFQNQLQFIDHEQIMQIFYLHQLLFSTLLHSDKADVILEKRHDILPELDLNFIYSFRQNHGHDQPTTDLNRLKNKAFVESLNSLKQVFNPKQHLYSVTLPTGLGKTITSLALALHIRQLLCNPMARIVIAIPFTSIIDQNFNVIQDIFENPNSETLLKHHHLADPEYKTRDEDEVLADQESKFLIETWQSSLIITTFVQLLEGIFSNNKSKLLKFPNLTNSVIVLDEVQNIRHELWEPIRRAFQILGEHFNCYFVMMSATQPLIFEPENEIRELVPNHRAYFQSPFFNRTRLVNRTNVAVTFDEFCQEIINYHELYQTKSLLIILNTKDFTRKCFEKLRDVIPSENANLFFLSTYLTPFERKRIIEHIKGTKNKGDKPNIIVSTQLIEAGVDISVDTVFRALAPLDSIIQAAGRANRYNEQSEMSDVFVYLIEGDMKRLSSRIYGEALIEKTMQVLKNVEIVEEQGYLELIEAYFLKIKSRADNMESKLLGYISELDFEQVGKFEFIEEQRTQSVFIQLNEEARQVWSTYLKIERNEEQLNAYDKKAAFAKIKGRFYDFVINVTVPYGQNDIDFDSEPEHFFYVSKLESPSSFYQYDYKTDGKDYRKNLGYVKKKAIDKYV